jgi:hypothetical protein
LRQFSHLRLVDDVLYREIIIGEDRKRQLVLPTAHIQTILEALHDDMGHPGKDRMLSLIRDRFYWPGMDKAVEEWISQCGRCIRRKTPASIQRAPLVSISTQFPLELVCIHFLTLSNLKADTITSWLSQTTLLDMLKLYQLGTRQQTTAQTL